MKAFSNKALRVALLAAAVTVAVLTSTTLAHHSFAMYDTAKTITFTGVLTSFVSQANHAEIHFIPLGPDGKPMKTPTGDYVQWGVEMAGAAAMAQQGVSVTTFPARTIFSVSLHPLRDGKNFGTIEGPIYKCPKDKPPSAGKHCNSVENSTQHGRGNFNANATAQ
jgi:hypothetical protein